jgi:OmpA-OmpF porin, OOP family
MSSENTLQNWKGKATVLSLLAFLSASCGAEVRNPALERGRNAYERVRRDPTVAGRAAVALEKTRSTLEEAERVWAEEKDANEVEHLVYLTEKRAEIALATARRRIAADEIQQLRPQR